MFRWFRNRSAATWLAGLVIGVVIGAGAYGVGFTVGSSNGSSQQSPLLLGDMLLQATASHGERSLTLATGSIDEEAEGLFVLDHVTGDLQCWVPSTRRPGAFSGMFKTNVLSDLGVEADKTPQLVMVTGTVNYRGSSSTTRPANAIVYVADSNTGNVVGYSIAWNRSMASSGGSQSGALVRVLAGKGRTAAIRPGGVGVGGPGGLQQP